MLATLRIRWVGAAVSMLYCRPVVVVNNLAVVVDSTVYKLVAPLIQV